MFFLYGSVFFDKFIAIFSVADISLFFLFLFAIKDKKSIQWSKLNFFYFIFIASSLFALTMNYNKEYFVIASFLLSYSKLLMYSLFLLVIPRYCIDNIKVLDKILKRLLLFILLFGVIEIIVNYAGYSAATFFFSEKSYGLYRMKSIYSEPSYFIFALMIFFFLVYEDIQISKWLYLLVFALSILTFSMSVYTVLLFGILILNYKTIKLGYKKAFIILGVIVCAIIIYRNVPIIQTHIQNLITFKPSSATTRIFGSLEYAIRAPWSGVGMGMIENYYMEGILKLFFVSTITGAVNNIFAAIRISSGVVALISFLIYIIIKYRNLGYFYIFLVFCFGTGHFNSSGFFFVLILMEILYIKKREIKYE